MWKLIKLGIRGKSRNRLALALILTLLQAICDVVVPFLMLFLNQILLVSNPLQTWFPGTTYTEQGLIIGGIMTAIAIVSLGLGMWASVLSARVGSDMAYNLRFELYNKIQRYSLADLDNFKVSSLMTRISSDVQIVRMASIFSIRTIVRSFFIYFGGLIMIIAIPFIWPLLSSMSGAPSDAGFNASNSWHMPVVMIVATLVLAIGLTICIVPAIPYFLKTQKATDSVNNVMQENILGQRTIKSFNLQSYQEKRFAKVSRDLTFNSKRADFWVFAITPTIYWVIDIATVVVIMIATNYGNNAALMVGPIIQIMSLMMMGMILTVFVFVQIGRAKASALRLNQILVYEPTIKFDPNGKNIIDKATGRLAISPSITFDHVSFKYSDESGEVLKDINLTINQNDMVGIIGSTGSGKTTLVNLICRLYDVSSGNIQIGDTDLKTISKESLRHDIAYSPQNVQLFSGTIASNIQFGKPNASEQEMIDAAKQAQAYEFISTREMGFDSIVEQRGQNFSGGQKQRIALTRALIKKSPILILDSSTSALDMITEKALNDELQQYKVGRTILVIAQRISSVKNCDKIIVLENGMVKGYDTHQNLLRNCDAYYNIAVSQLGEQGVQDELGYQ